MENLALKPIYEKVFGETFDYTDVQMRKKLQRCMYLATELGLNVGEYYFSWYKNGPFSVQLEDDIKKIPQHPKYELAFSPLAESIIAKVKAMIDAPTGYTKDMWLDCLAAMRYLKGVYRCDYVRVMTEIRERTPHLDNEEGNQAAFRIA
jgi:uncharacterized protein YwgA